MTKKKQSAPIDVVRAEAPALLGRDTARGRGAALVNEVLNPAGADRAAAALFQLLDLVNGIEDGRERTEVTFYCMVQCGLYFDEHLEVLKAVTAALKRAGARKDVPRRRKGAARDES